jgi:hypothetical protein
LENDTVTGGRGSTRRTTANATSKVGDKEKETSTTTGFRRYCKKMEEERERISESGERVSDDSLA